MVPIATSAYPTAAARLPIQMDCQCLFSLINFSQLPWHDQLISELKTLKTRMHDQVRGLRARGSGAASLAAIRNRVLNDLVCLATGGSLSITAIPFGNVARLKQSRGEVDNGTILYKALFHLLQTSWQLGRDLQRFQKAGRDMADGAKSRCKSGVYLSFAMRRFRRKHAVLVQLRCDPVVSGYARRRAVFGIPKEFPVWLGRIFIRRSIRYW